MWMCAHPYMFYSQFGRFPLWGIVLLQLELVFFHISVLGVHLLHMHPHHPNSPLCLPASIFYDIGCLCLGFIMGFVLFFQLLKAWMVPWCFRDSFPLSGDSSVHFWSACTVQPWGGFSACCAISLWPFGVSIVDQVTPLFTCGSTCAVQLEIGLSVWCMIPLRPCGFSVVCQVTGDGRQARFRTWRHFPLYDTLIWTGLPDLSLIGRPIRLSLSSLVLIGARHLCR